MLSFFCKQDKRSLCTCFWCRKSVRNVLLQHVLWLEEECKADSVLQLCFSLPLLKKAVHSAVLIRLVIEHSEVYFLPLTLYVFLPLFCLKLFSYCVWIPRPEFKGEWFLHRGSWHGRRVAESPEEPVCGGRGSHTLPGSPQQGVQHNSLSIFSEYSQYFLHF